MNWEAELYFFLFICIIYKFRSNKFDAGKQQSETSTFSYDSVMDNLLSQLKFELLLKTNVASATTKLIIVFA